MFALSVEEINFDGAGLKTVEEYAVSERGLCWLMWKQENQMRGPLS